MAVTYNLDHIHLNGPDVEATAAFYERVFGMRRIRKFDGFGMTFIQLDLSGVRLTITSREPLATGRFNAVDHFALQVPDLQAAIADLRAKGVTLLTEPAKLDMGTRTIDLVFVQGPDGVAIEIIAPTTA